MEIKILRPVSLDIEGKQKVYSPSDKTISISDDLAKEKNYAERYQKYPKHIQIIKLPNIDKEVLKEQLKAEIKEELEQEEIKIAEDELQKEVVPEAKPKAKKATKTKE